LIKNFLIPGGEGDLVEFKPSVAGRYKLTLTYGGEEIPGSPLVYTVQEDRTPTVFGKGLTLGQVRDVCSFKIDGRDMEGEPRVEVSGRTRTVLQVKMRMVFGGKKAIEYLLKNKY